MKTFIWTMVVIYALEIIGKASMIQSGNLIRKPSHMLIDIAIAVGLIVWAAWLLGTGA